MPTDLILYGTIACHLCEEAEALVLQTAPELSLTKVDIVDDEQLFATYRYSIPVLKDHQGRELFWPFDANALKEFLS